jgi:dihydroorotate dehydrogenase (fumarate)
MIRLLSSATSLAYRHVAKPILFQFSPDSVHEYITHVGKYVQRFGWVRAVTYKIFAYEDDILRTTVAGIELKNPVGLSAGFDMDFQLPPLLRSFGFGFMEGGSMTFLPCPGNPKPWFYRLPKTKSLVVNKGLANQGAKASIATIAQYKSDILADFPINISVAKTNLPVACDDAGAIADYVGSLKLIKKAGVGDMITLNISCPNAYGGEPFTTPERLDTLLAEVDRLQLSQPVFVKMPCDMSWKEFSALVDVVDAHAITGLTMVNLAKNRTKMSLKDDLPTATPGNMSGMPTQMQSDDMIRRTRQKYGKRFYIIGVGGIFSAEDAYRKITLGADAVELITGMIFEGPQLIGQINEGIAGMLRRDGFTSVAEAVGSALRDNVGR